MEVDIEIFYHSDETAALKDSGVDYSILECDTKIMTFYDIACLVPYQDEKSGEWFCKIFSGGESFIATKSGEEIKKIIHDHKNNL